MKKLSVVLAFVLLQVAFGQTSAPRPRILGIDHVSFYTTAPEGVKKLYGDLLGLTSAAPAEPGGALRYTVGKQWVVSVQRPIQSRPTAWTTLPCSPTTSWRCENT